MKALLVVLVFGSLVSFASQAARIQELQETVAVKLKVPDLGVSLAADKRRYSRREQIKLEVKLTNTDAVKDIFVYGTLELGHRGSFTLYLRDAKGKEVPPRIIFEAVYGHHLVSNGGFGPGHCVLSPRAADRTQKP